jgi:2-amino-4-hydroxy-6-hydroxymethyldihydropteridine diphosphokinase
VAIGLGSNVGDRLTALRSAVREMRRFLTDLRVSHVFEASPVHVTDQPDFLNACCTGVTPLTPRQLFSELKDLEQRAGRAEGGIRYGPRILDLDLLLFGSLVCETDDLTIPHPRLHERAFVLVPLAELAGDWVVPTGKARQARTVEDLAAAVDPTGIRRTTMQLDGP